MRAYLALALASLVAIGMSCAPEEVVVWSMPPRAAAGGAGTPAVMGGAAGSMGGAAAGNTAPSGGSGGSSGGGTSAANSAGGGSTGGTPAAAGSAGAGGALNGECTSNEDCPVSWICAKDDCHASSGVCEPRPVFCPPEPAPVCGCDKVTYWNDCVRRQSGAPAAEEGECRSGALPCEKGDDCGVPNASCARFFPRGEPCDENAPGVCWVAPAVCEPGVDPMRWHDCTQTDPLPPCMDTCQAIQSECAVHMAHDDECQ